MTTVIMCLSLNNDILNANMTLFEMSLLSHLDINDNIIYQYITYITYITYQCLCHDSL